MSKALTPSQLKAELETQKDALLKACLYALNEIPNRRLSGPYASTYALAEQVSKLLHCCLMAASAEVATSSRPWLWGPMPCC